MCFDDRVPSAISPMLSGPTPELAGDSGGSVRCPDARLPVQSGVGFEDLVYALDRHAALALIGNTRKTERFVVTELESKQ
jgi:hypothetical protein